MIKRTFLYLEVFFVLFSVRLLLSYKGVNCVLELTKTPKFKFIGNKVLRVNIKTVEKLSRFIPNCTCLVKAIALKLVATSQHKLKLVIGITNTPKFASHAWIERNNKIIFGQLENQNNYSALMEIL